MSFPTPSFAMLRSPIHIAVLLAMLAGSHPALAAPATPPAVTTTANAPALQRESEGVREFRLDNGLRILLLNDASADKTLVNLSYHVGSRHENYGESGLAHILEHMLFRGTTTLPAEKRELEMTHRGISGNATTNPDVTQYFQTFASNADTLNWVLQMEADRMRHATITSDALAIEMKVVRNEMERGENKPARMLQQKMLAVAYDWHGYGRSTIGARSDVEQITPPAMRQFYDRYYQPDNATLIVAGRFDEAAVLQAIQRSFGPIPRPARQLADTHTREPAQEGPREVTLRRKGGNPLLAVLYHIPAASHPDAAPLAVLANMLTRGPDSLLGDNLLDRELAEYVGQWRGESREPDYLLFFVELSQKHNVEKARNVLLEQLEQQAAARLKEEDIRLAKQSLLNEMERNEIRISAFGQTLADFQALGDWRMYFAFRDQLEKVTADDLRRVAKAYLNENNRTLGYYQPVKDNTAIPIPEQDGKPNLDQLDNRPLRVSGEAFEANAANLMSRVQNRTLENGMRVHMLPRSTRLGAVRARLIVPFGSAESLQGRTMQAELLADMLRGGAEGMRSGEISTRLNKLKATIHAKSRGNAAVQFDISARRDTLADTLDIVHRMLNFQDLPSYRFKYVQDSWIADLQAEESHTGDQADNVLEALLDPYPAGDIRHTPNHTEKLQAVREMSVDDLVSINRKMLAFSDASLSITGDVDPDSLTPVLQLMGRPRGQQPYHRISTPYQASVASTRVLAIPGKASADYRAGIKLQLNVQDEDMPAIAIASYILGEDGNARLWQRLRNQEGLSYSASSALVPDWTDDRNSALYLQASFPPQQRSKLASAISEEMQRFWENGITAEELQRAKIGLRQEAAKDWSEESWQLAMLSRLPRQKLDFIAYQRLLDQLDTQTLAQVNAAIRRHLSPTKLVQVLAGSFD